MPDELKYLESFRNNLNGLVTDFRATIEQNKEVFEKAFDVANGGRIPRNYTNAPSPAMRICVATLAEIELAKFTKDTAGVLDPQGRLQRDYLEFIRDEMASPNLRLGVKQTVPEVQDFIARAIFRIDDERAGELGISHKSLYELNVIKRWVEPEGDKLKEYTQDLVNFIKSIQPQASIDNDLDAEHEEKRKRDRDKLEYLEGFRKELILTKDPTLEAVREMAADQMKKITLIDAAASPKVRIQGDYLEHIMKEMSEYSLVKLEAYKKANPDLKELQPDPDAALPIHRFSGWDNEEARKVLRLTPDDKQLLTRQAEIAIARISPGRAEDMGLNVSDAEIRVIKNRVENGKNLLEKYQEADRYMRGAVKGMKNIDLGAEDVSNTGSRIERKFAAIGLK